MTRVYSRGSLYKTLGSLKGTKEILVVDCTFMYFTHTLNIIRKNQHLREISENYAKTELLSCEFIFKFQRFYDLALTS